MNRNTNMNRSMWDTTYWANTNANEGRWEKENADYENGKHFKNGVSKWSGRNTTTTVMIGVLVVDHQNFI